MSVVAAVVPPVQVMRPRTAAEIPAADGLPGGVQYSVKLDGFRCVAFARGAAPPVLQSRSGRDMRPDFPDVAAAIGALPDGLVLDGEVCAWADGAFAFHQLMRPHAARVADGVVVAYVAFDVLAVPGRDVRELPLEQRWELLGGALREAGPQVQRVLATTDREQALVWYEALVGQGVEGLVCKGLASRYRPREAKSWVKVRHTDTRDAAVVGYTGTARAPRALVLVLPGDADPLLSSPLTPTVRAQAREALAGLADEGEERIVAIGLGDVPYRRVGAGLLAEVRQNVGRHATSTVLRLRHADG
ncbi:ATP-dependent DNA ligase [Streptomyces albidochromogenes]|uniref:DNA ligase n=1 Tax=Streptomyces albidochromogenes TaxID=329524 RepID=A0ABW6FIR5_9ACTN